MIEVYIKYRKESESPNSTMTELEHRYLVDTNTKNFGFDTDAYCACINTALDKFRLGNPLCLIISVSLWETNSKVISLG